MFAQQIVQHRLELIVARSGECARAILGLERDPALAARGRVGRRVVQLRRPLPELIECVRVAARAAQARRGPSLFDELLIGRGRGVDGPQATSRRGEQVRFAIARAIGIAVVGYRRDAVVGWNVRQRDRLAVRVPGGFGATA